jgi:hypothetical protein
MPDNRGFFALNAAKIPVQAGKSPVIRAKRV